MLSRIKIVHKYVVERLLPNTYLGSLLRSTVANNLLYDQETPQCPRMDSITANNRSEKQQL